MNAVEVQRDAQAKKRTLKGQTTRFGTFIEHYNKQTDTVEDLRRRYSNYENQYHAIQTALDVLSRYASDEDFDELIAEKIAVDEQYYKYSKAMDKILSTDQRTSETSTPVGSVRGGSSHIKLPTLQLPTFSGEVEEWLSFHDLFDSLINRNESLTEVQRFHYLRTSLKGDAANVIQALSICDSNYQVAWGMLKVRYENRKLIVETLLKKLFALPAVQNESAVSIRTHLNQFQKNTRALESIGQPTVDTLLVYLSVSKLDSATRQKWEEHSLQIESPTQNDLTDFLMNRCQVLEASGAKSVVRVSTTSGVMNKSARMNYNSHVSTNVVCPVCGKDHFAHQCGQFAKMSHDQKLTEVRDRKMCFNCLRVNHKLDECKSRGCFTCNRRHHTSLHAPTTSTVTATATTSATPQTPHAYPSHPSTAHQKNDQLSNRYETHETVATPGTSVQVPAGTNTTVLNCLNTNGEVLLSTVLVNVVDKFGIVHTCRALLDSGSQTNFITTEFAQMLQLNKTQINSNIRGVGGITKINTLVRTTIQSMHNNYTAQLSLLVINDITSNLPHNYIKPGSFHIPDNISLADPTFNVPSKISMLIGAEIFYDLHCVGQIQLLRNGPILQKTLLGWIVSGRYTSPSIKINKNVSCNIVSLKQLHNDVARFWEIEHVSESITYILREDHINEKHFVRTINRNAEGRFIVSLPFNNKISKLGSSQQMALNRFKTLERKLIANSSLREQYTQFMNEYESMGHMTALEEDDGKGYYLPHHAVLKEESTTSKLRVVFDGSAKTSAQLSINDTLHAGYIVQDDLFSILLRFRKHPIVLTADIAKMFRQVLVHENDRKYQKIYWRSSSDLKLRTYELNTITYGTTCAPYLSTRCLVELANIYSTSHARASEVVKRDFYVDDCITGCNTAAEAISLKTELQELLQLGGFPLRKWRCNADIFPRNMSDADQDFTHTEQKTLGITWNSAEDTLRYSTLKPGERERVTKRSILRYVARLWDPLGLLNPIIVKAKVILQKLWMINLHWDESVTGDLNYEWSEYVRQLEEVVKFVIPRRICDWTGNVSYELHGFCDASQHAYGACIYIKATNTEGLCSSRLLCAKSRVAPIKCQTIPRLELCSATLLSELSEKVCGALNMRLENVYYWTDSTIVLSWLNRSPTDLKTFVSNRVSRIQSSTDIECWRHVRTDKNPADIISRGATPAELLSSELWWTGPDFLLFNKTDWPVLPTINTEVIEMKTTEIVAMNICKLENLLQNYSSYAKLKRIVALCVRFTNNCKLKTGRQYGHVTIRECRAAEVIVCRILQQTSFESDIKTLRAGKELPRSSRICSLHAFLDKEDVLRVGGRIQNANVSYNQQHPIILPRQHHITRLIIEEGHLRHLHAGPRAVLAALRTKYWPIGGLQSVKSVLLKCVRCHKVNPKPISQLMGNLPSARVRPARPFATSGVDFCGPFSLRTRRQRGIQTTKGYVAVFVCFVTRAVHLELVTDMTSAACLAALRRFIARRGMVQHLYSDNGTNFVGVHNELKRLGKAFADNAQELVNMNIEWHFIPPRSPHMGGIWEAAVKSSKYHLLRVAGDANLTYEEFITLLAQIEACLNSRPLVPLTEDPDDVGALTPGHFLIGDALTTIPDEPLQDIRQNKLSNWQLVQQLQQHFWCRWHKEVLAEMQQRTKWTNTTDAIKVGTLVTIKEDNVPPLRWRMGRVIQLHMGKDNVCRVVSLKTSGGVTKITINKLCIVPCE